MQRVPATEKRGRRHSSEVVVVALDEGANGSATGDIRRRAVRVDTFRCGGKGGQNVNKVETGVRITDLATGVVVKATEERSQHQNREVAWRRLEEALARGNAEQQARGANQERAATFEEFRSFTWTGWRDEVKGPEGVRTPMGRALAGRLDPLMGATAR